MINKIILASKSGVRKKILDKNQIKCEVIPSNVDEDEVKNSLIKEGASPEVISKNIEIIPVENVDQVLKIALTKPLKRIEWVDVENLNKDNNQKSSASSRH